MGSLSFLVVDGDQIIVGGGEANKDAAANAETQTSNQPAPDANMGIVSWLPMLAYLVVIVAAMYFFAIRPQRKKEKALQDMQSAIKIGDPIVTSSGMFGKVVDITADTFIIEFGTNKGVRIPIQKSEIIGVKEPNLTLKKEDISE